jgi:hypothetical protein
MFIIWATVVALLTACMIALCASKTSVCTVNGATWVNGVRVSAATTTGKNIVRGKNLKMTTKVGVGFESEEYIEWPTGEGTEGARSEGSAAVGRL